MAGPLADFVVSLNTDGYIVSQGSVNDALAKDATLAEELKHEEEAVELDESEETATKPAEEKKGKLVVAEEIAIGRVSWNAGKHPLAPNHRATVFHGCLTLSLVRLFLDGLGGKWPLLWWIQFLGASSLTEVFDVLEMWWLGWWATQYATKDPRSVSIG